MKGLLGMEWCVVGGCVGLGLNLELGGARGGGEGGEGVGRRGMGEGGFVGRD